MKRIAVIGDVMLDEYLTGKVTRVSPEAPIPIVSTNGEAYYVPGGCGNVANNISALGIEVEVFSLWGTDYAGKKLNKYFAEHNIRFDNRLSIDNLSTIVKRRIIGNGQQIVRIDCNDLPSINDADRDILLGVFLDTIDEFEIVILSDYAKGICDEYLCEKVIEACNKKGIPVIVDPKGENWGKYKGAFLITPNLKEVKDFSGHNYLNTDESLDGFFKEYSNVIDVSFVLITRSEKGMSLYSKEKESRHYRSVAKDVFDVSGAGDTVVAAISVWLFENRGDLSNAIDFANTAAGIAVGKAGTSVVSREEIDLERKKNDEMILPPIIMGNQEDYIASLIDRWRKKGYSIVTTNGCFDILHRGHVSLLREAKRFGDKLVVCINSDESVRRLKGEKRPINPESDRAFMVSSIKYVDAVVIFDEMRQGKSNTDVPYRILEIIAPDVHVKGGDYSLEDVPEAKYAKRFIAVEYIKDCSTTGIIGRINERTDTIFER